jgi:hypothetical protein
MMTKNSTKNNLFWAQYSTLSSLELVCDYPVSPSRRGFGRNAGRGVGWSEKAVKHCWECGGLPQAHVGI